MAGKLATPRQNSDEKEKKKGKLTDLSATRNFIRILLRGVPTLRHSVGAVLSFSNSWKPEELCEVAAAEVRAAKPAIMARTFMLGDVVQE